MPGIRRGLLFLRALGVARRLARRRSSSNGEAWRALETAVARLAAGDLATPIDIQGTGPSSRLGVALETMRRTLRRQTASARRLQELSAQVAAHLELERVLESVASAIARLLEADKSGVLLMDEETGKRRAVAAHGLSDWFLETVPGLPIGHFVWAAGETSAPGTVVVQSDPIWAELRRTGDREGFQSLFVFPLLGSGPTLLGTLFVAWARARKLDSSEIDLVQLFAQQACFAIEHAQLYRELDRRAAELQRSREQIMAYARDLNEALQKELETVERLRELDQMKSEFVSLVSHELGNPIATIANYAHMLVEHGSRLSEDQRREMARTIEREVEQLSQLVQDVLTVSRLESERLSFNFQAMDLAALVRNVVDEYRSRSQRHPIEVRTLAPSSLVHGDPLRLRQVLANLLSNAIKYSPDGGPIVVEVAPCQAEDEVRTWIRDNGLGIAAEDLGRLFHKFSRIERGRASTIGGTGLGLYVARKIVQAHGGGIWAESEPGRGTTITFSLPLLVAQVSDSGELAAAT